MGWAEDCARVSNHFSFFYAFCLFLEEGCCVSCLYGYFYVIISPPASSHPSSFNFLPSLHKCMLTLFSNRYYHTHSPSSPSSCALTLRRKMAIEKRRVDCMRETYFDVRVVRGSKR